MVLRECHVVPLSFCLLLKMSRFHICTDAESWTDLFHISGWCVTAAVFRKKQQPGDFSAQPRFVLFIVSAPHRFYNEGPSSALACFPWCLPCLLICLQNNLRRDPCWQAAMIKTISLLFYSLSDHSCTPGSAHLSRSHLSRASVTPRSQWAISAAFHKHPEKKSGHCVIGVTFARLELSCLVRWWSHSWHLLLYNTTCVILTGTITQNVHVT